MNPIPGIERKIIHVDMDAFYASVEQRDNPALQGKAIAVGGEEKRGVITTASYEARKYGVRSAMPGYKAKELCPHLIFVPLRFDAYREASRQIREIFYRYSDLVEPLSLDEAYIDITKNKKGIELGMDVAIEIKKAIKAELNLTASAGVSYCKFVAKIASDIRKPDGLTVIHPDRVIPFLEKLPIEKFYGVGRVTAQKMRTAGIYTGKDLKQWSLSDLTKNYGKPGKFYYHIVRGIDLRPVQPNRVRKSLAVEETLEENLTTLEEIEQNLYKIIEKLYARIQKAKCEGRTLTLKLKTADFQIITKGQTQQKVIKEKAEITEIAKSLLVSRYEVPTPIRLIGLTLSNLTDDNAKDAEDGQLSLEF
jgi:DNA polymerase-4